ncbi:protein STICHEL [Impatiens glandulifera]|uniref:protein STICHEL n=1 Tax=Impatiens glandulifera TaxID=253017 RepID=UPI001FB1488D|nr:protein STICHEL [Impatiens glandulifera]
MSEIRGRGCSSHGGIDPSNLHLKKELTQIRKASRVLRDPGTTSSWRSPMSSARSAAAIMAASSSYGHTYRQNKSVNVTAVSGVERESKLGTGNGNGRDKKIFLHNWIMQRSSSEKSANTAKSEEKRLRKDQADDANDESSSSSAPAEEEEEESVGDSLSDARNGGDTKSDTCIADRYASMIFKCNDAKLTPSVVRRTIPKRKAKKNIHSSAFRQKMMNSRNSKQPLEGAVRSIGNDLDRDDSVSLLDQSDDTEGYCNFEDLGRAAAASSSSPTALLSRLKKSKLLKNHSKKEDSSFSYSTPALSTSSYNRYFNRNPSTIGSWDATTVSFNDGDEEVDDTLDLPGQQGCGIPCYWSKKMTPKNKGGGCGSCYSPSLSDTLRRQGNRIFCGSQSIHHRNRRGSLSGSKKKRLASRSAQGVIPLLTNGDDGQGDSSMGSDDELSTNYGEIDLEALSRLDGRRWSTSCRSNEGLELVALNEDGEVEEGMQENLNRSLSQKYRPMFFEEIVGQTIVVQSLVNAVSRGRISPVYLFQGPRGTGKTSMARVFAAALNCLATEETKPCGVCRECADFISGKSRNIKEVDITSKKGIESFKHLLKLTSSGSSSAFCRRKVFVIDECHLLPSKMWLAFMKFLEEPSSGAVFLFSTTDLDNIPRTVLSRCQKYIFNKIKDADIVTRLRKLSEDENLDVESDALDLIAANADGSLRDAETMLDQLSLLGKRITTSLVNELVGVVSEEKLLELLELALSSDTAETVKKAREMMDSGVDPIVVMSQLATLIMDIIAGTYHIMDSRSEESTLGGGNLTEGELERFKHALKLLSEAEKQLRVSTERSTWFTATLLQLGSIPSSDPPTQSGSSRRQSSKTTEEDPSSTSREAIVQKQRSDAHYSLRRSSCSSPTSLLNTAFQYLNNSPRLVDGAGDMIPRCTDSSMLADIWLCCIEKCHSKTLKQLLLTHGKLISILEADGYFVAYVTFADGDIKIRAERFLSSITNSFENVLQCNVEVRMVVAGSGDEISASKQQKQVDVPKNIRSRERRTVSGSIEIQSRGVSFDGSSVGRNLQLSSSSSIAAASPVRKPEIQNQRIETIIREQRLENAWLQAMEKGTTPGSVSRLKPEKNQVLPQDGTFPPPAKQLESVNSLDKSSQRWQDELNHELKLLNIDNNVKILEEQTGHHHHHHSHPISPSLLHGTNFRGNFTKDNNMGYESGTGAGGCSGLFCWNNGKNHPRRGKVVSRKEGTRFSLFGECVSRRKAEKKNRVRR